VRGGIAVVGAGALWAVLCLWLASAGEVPSGPVPGDSSGWYALQARLVVPMMVLQWALLTGSAHGLARRLGGEGAFRDALDALGLSWAGPLAGLFALEIVIFGLAGLDGLGWALPVLAPAAAVTVVVGSVRAVRACYGLSTGRALLVAFLALFVTALVGGPLLR